MASDVGGTWLYSEDVPKGRGNVYRSLVTNLPKEIMQYVLRLSLVHIPLEDCHHHPVSPSAVARV